MRSTHQPKDRALRRTSPPLFARSPLDPPQPQPTGPDPDTPEPQIPQPPLPDPLRTDIT